MENFYVRRRGGRCGWGRHGGGRGRGGRKGKRGRGGALKALVMYLTLLRIHILRIGDQDFKFNSLIAVHIRTQFAQPRYLIFRCLGKHWAKYLTEKEKSLQIV